MLVRGFVLWCGLLGGWVLLSRWAGLSVALVAGCWWPAWVLGRWVGSVQFVLVWGLFYWLWGVCVVVFGGLNCEFGC